MSITLRVSDDPLMHVLQSDSVYVNDTNDQRDKDGWFPMKLMAGEYFDFEITFTAGVDDGVREILGFEIDYDVHGEY